MMLVLLDIISPIGTPGSEQSLVYPPILEKIPLWLKKFNLLSVFLLLNWSSVRLRTLASFADYKEP